MWDGSSGNLLSTLDVRYAHDHRWATGQKDGCEACHVGTACQKCQRPLRGLGKGICALVWFLLGLVMVQVAKLYNMWAPVQVSLFGYEPRVFWISYHAVFPNRTSWTRRWRNKRGRGRYRPRLPDSQMWLKCWVGASKSSHLVGSHNISTQQKSSGQMARFDHPMNPHASSRFKLPRNAWRSGERKSYAPTRLLVAGFREPWPCVAGHSQVPPSIPLTASRISCHSNGFNWILGTSMQTTWYPCTCCNRGWVKKVDRGSESVNGPRQRLFPFTGIKEDSAWVMLRLAKPSKQNPYPNLRYEALWHQDSESTPTCMALESIIFKLTKLVSWRQTCRVSPLSLVQCEKGFQLSLALGLRVSVQHDLGPKLWSYRI